jgi:aminoglycoside phosphotransferase family enzyme
LHLRNIVRLDGVPTLFDGVEFNDEISCVDVMYDLAFLLMDLWRRGLPAHANAVLNGYLAETADVDSARPAAVVPVVPRGGARQDRRGVRGADGGPGARGGAPSIGA